MPEGASGGWPGAPYARYVVGGRATRSLAAPCTYSEREGRPSSKEKQRCEPFVRRWNADGV